MKNLPVSAQRRAAKSQAQSDAGLRETTESSMIEAHLAGAAYWRLNRPLDASRKTLAALARSCGWHGEDNTAWLAGFYGAMRRDHAQAEPATAYDLADKLAALPRLDSIEEFGPLVLDIMRGASRTAFQQLDDQPGRYGGADCYDWFYMLRQVRNHADYGARMFAAFT